jgi:hypothetical protein
VPMVGWPAKGISAAEVKISIFRSVGAVPICGRWRKTVSERLNSAEMACFCDCVRDSDSDAGTWTMATGFPAYRVLVNTSRVVNESCILTCWLR